MDVVIRPNAKTKRNREIVARYLRGAKQIDLAAEFGISRERVRQIVENAGETPSRQRNADLAAAREAGRTIVAHTMSAWRRRCGTRLSYDRGCRCDLCRRANADYHRAKMHRLGRSKTYYSETHRDAVRAGLAARRERHGE